MDGGFFWLVLEIGFVRCGLGCGKLLLAGAGGLEAVPMVQLLQPLWLRRRGLRRILIWRGLVVVLLGLLFAVSLLLAACCTVLVSGLLWVLVAGLLRRLLVPVLGWVGGTAGWLLILAVADLVNLRYNLQYHVARRSGAGH